MANCVCVMKKILRFKLLQSLYKFNIPGKRHATRARRQEAVSDWLNPHSLGTMSAFGCIENFA